MNAKHQGHSELTLMFTDIVGYSRLMGRDESLAIQMLGDYRHILLAHIAEHNGVFIEFAGDAIFARFDNALNAVNAAVAIQKHLQLFNQGKEKSAPLLQTRIGLHKGSVLLSGNAVLGDDVNIAARLEPLSVPDGICISKTVYDDVRLQLREPIKPLGAQSLKNIEHKIRAYLVKPSGIKIRDHLHYFWLGCSKKISAYRYPIAVSVLLLIAVGIYFIPRWLVPGYAANYVEIANFQNLMNANGESDYFSAGITEAVRSQLADMRDVYLVEADKGIHAPIRLEGSVQKLGDNVRIAYRILRRDGNIQIAGGKLDGAYQDIFVLQDRLVGEIAKYLASEFKLQNFRPAPLKLTSDVTAYDYYLQGMDFLAKPLSDTNFDAAAQRFNQALVHDESFPSAYSGLCDLYRKKYVFTQSSSWVGMAERYCLKAIGLDNGAKAYEAIGALYRDSGRYNDAIVYLNKSLEKYPDNVSGATALARVYDLIGDTSKSESIYIDVIKRFPKNWIAYQEYGSFLSRHGFYQKAVKNFIAALEYTPQNAVTLYNLGGAYLYLGDFPKAAEVLERSAKLDPTSGVFLNTGTMYFFSGNYTTAVDMYKQALRLQPDDFEVLANIADAYNFLSDGKESADLYFNKVKDRAEIELKINSANIQAYQFLALARNHFGDFELAKAYISDADKLDPKNMFSLYIRLRIAISENNSYEIDRNLVKLLKEGYSKELILADPYFKILSQEKYKTYFNY